MLGIITHVEVIVSQAKVYPQERSFALLYWPVSLVAVEVSSHLGKYWVWGIELRSRTHVISDLPILHTHKLQKVSTLPG